MMTGFESSIKDVENILNDFAKSNGTSAIRGSHLDYPFISICILKTKSAGYVEKKEIYLMPKDLHSRKYKLTVIISKHLTSIRTLISNFPFFKKSPGSKIDSFRFEKEIAEFSENIESSKLKEALAKAKAFAVHYKIDKN